MKERPALTPEPVRSFHSSQDLHTAANNPRIVLTSVGGTVGLLPRIVIRGLPIPHFFASYLHSHEEGQCLVAVSTGWLAKRIIGAEPELQSSVLQRVSLK